MKNTIGLVVLILIVFCTYGQDLGIGDEVDALIKEVGAKRYKEPISALKLAEKALTISRENNLSEHEAKSLKALGGVHYIKGDYDKSLSSFLDAFNIFQQSKDTTNMSQLLSNLGLVYKNIGDNEKSLEHYNRALALQESNPDTLTVSRLLNNVGVIYKNLEQYDQALSYFERSLELKKIVDDKKGVANSYTNLGIIKSQQGNDKEALNFFFQSLKMEMELGLEEGVAKNYNNIALSYLQLDRCDSAIYFARKGLEIGERLETKIQIKEASEILTNCLAKSGNYQQAFRYQSLATSMKDSLMNEEKARDIGRLESRLKMAAQEAEINLLEAQNQLAEAELGRKQIMQVSLIIAIVLVISISVYIVITQRQKNRLKEQALMGELTELRDQIKLMMAKYEESFDTDIDTLNEKLVEPLSTREFEALRLTVEGKQNREIAEALFISTNTVKFHLRNIYTKLGVNNRKEALEYVVKSS